MARKDSTTAMAGTGFTPRFFARLNRLCYVICVLSIAVAAATAFVGIWSRLDDGLMWRGLGSSLVSFSACGLTVAVNTIIGRRIVLDAAPPACDMVQ